jgi:hypothetical protein
MLEKQLVHKLVKLMAFHWESWKELLMDLWLKDNMKDAKMESLKEVTIG